METFRSTQLLGESDDRRFRRMGSESVHIRAGMLGLAAHESFEMHAHTESSEIFFFVSGRATYWDQWQEGHAIGPGDLIVVEPGEMHAFRAGDDNLVVLAVVAPNLNHKDTVYAETAGRP